MKRLLRFLPPLGLPERMRPKPRSQCYWVALHFPGPEQAAAWFEGRGPRNPDPYTRLLKSGERLPYHGKETE